MAVIPSQVESLSNNSFKGIPLDSIKLNSGLKKLGAYSLSADATNKGITELILPEGLQFIENNALTHNKFSSINIPSSVSFIGNNALYACYDLKTINIDRPKNSITGSPWGNISPTVLWK